ncbi:MAG: ABC transporter [Deltaproteobacteria bacterium CG2_30_63_29]|nr:MAG: ABC transporter [Deltaproteobacteria bacterium CG2_30_63_29]PJB34112.1 MAG: ABC transporter [Deltaproteobacteria bacterium CG_4_9_14_3_um_filter_63_12]
MSRHSEPEALDSRRQTLRSVLTHGFLVIVSFVVIYPVLWVVKMALTPNELAGLSPSPIPEKVTLSNFEVVLSTTDNAGHWLFGEQLLNSVIVSGLTTVLGIVLACTAAYAFSRFNFPLRKAGLMGFLVTQMFPGVVMAIPLYLLLGYLGLLDALVGLVLVYSVSALPFCVWMLKGYFDTIPKELEEAAVVDGASRMAIFLKIILPLAKPAIAVTALFSFMTAWNEFILAATFMNDERAYTLPVALKQYVGAQSVDYGYFAAGAIIVSIPIMALFFVLQKHLVGGLTAGSVKG